MRRSAASAVSGVRVLRATDCEPHIAGKFFCARGALLICEGSSKSSNAPPRRRHELTYWHTYSQHLAALALQSSRTAKAIRRAERIALQRAPVELPAKFLFATQQMRGVRVLGARTSWTFSASPRGKYMRSTGLDAVPGEKPEPKRAQRRGAPAGWTAMRGAASAFGRR